MRRKIDILCAAIVFVLALEARGDLLDQANQALSIHDPQNRFQVQRFLFNPRISLFLDAQFLNHFYFFAQTRLDRGFDPSDAGAQLRLDEYFVRYTPLDDARVNFQIGKFATAVGSWVRRHDSWQNPFINAPLPYENITTISDTEAPSSRQDFTGRRFQTNEQYERLPLIWGPNYTSGAAILGTIDKFDYAFEIKNAAVSSRPHTWQPTETDWSDPTFSGHVGMRSNESWNFGISGNVGPYMTVWKEHRQLQSIFARAGC